MRLLSWPRRAFLCSLACLLCLAGCAVERGEVYVKDGVRYGVISGRTWRGSWWDYYERGGSYASGEFWEDAMADFSAAIAQRRQDQRHARTYGMHFVDYFPHRELGIVYYRLGQHTQAVHELEASLAAAETARAKFYLNRARRALLQQTRRDTQPPRLAIDSPPDGFLTNRFSVTVSGRAVDDMYVAAIAVNGQRQFIELAAPQLSLSEEIALHDGVNTIDIVAEDLVGRQAQARITVHLDRHGPLLSLEQVETIGLPLMPRARIQGFLRDASRITRFVLAGQSVPLQQGSAWEFRQEVPLVPGATALPFEVADAAGNVTRGEIALVSPAAEVPGGRQGNLPLQLLPRWAWHGDERQAQTVITDLPDRPAVPLRMAQGPERRPPVITLASLQDQETVYDPTIYVEGRVTGAHTITAFALNGESLWQRKTRQLFFGQSVPLQVGDNRLVLDAVDEVGTSVQRTIIVHRAERPGRRLGARLRVALLPFDKAGAAATLSEIVYDALFNVLVNQRRFDLVERQRLDAILQEHKLSQKLLADPATAIRAGKFATADGIVAGLVTETPHSLEVLARLIDVETAVVLAAEDVYGEDLTPPTMKTLLEGLAWKFQRRFPLIEGFVMSKEGQHLITDLAEAQGIRQHMKLLIFRPGEEFKHPQSGRLLRKPDKIIGEARVTAVTADLSEAILLLSESSGEVQEADRVITK
jgi:Glucodextranase, domain B/Curli production assembly/transport component CsgG